MQIVCCAPNSGWSGPELRRQKASCLYERLALSRDQTGIKRLAKEGQITLPKDANTHAKEHQLYLPSKELLRQ